MSTTASSDLMSSFGGIGGIIGLVVSVVLVAVMVIGFVITCCACKNKGKTPVQPMNGPYPPPYGSPYGGYPNPGYYPPNYPPNYPPRAQRPVSYSNSYGGAQLDLGGVPNAKQLK